MSVAPLNAAHDYLGAGHDDAARRTRWVVVLTVVMMVAEIVAGQITGSMALLADGFHMATHAGALGVAAFAYRYARRHQNDPRYTFGTGKVGDLAGFASAVVLALLAIGIAWESATRLVHPTGVAFGDATLVAVAGLVVNLVSAVLLSCGHSHAHHDHDHGHGHGHGHDNNLRSAYLHVVADALTSVLAIVALLAGRYLGWLWLDPAVGILGAVVIARWSVGLMRDTAAVLLDSADPALVERIRAAVETPGDAAVVDLHVWKVGPASHAAIVEVASDVPCAAIRTRVMSGAPIAHLTVEMRDPAA